MIGLATRPLIALLTDFGVSDWYVGTMRAVIKSICPSADIVDITHEVARQSVIEGGFVLAAAAPWFPPETIFVAVVDPGVGGGRDPIIARCGGQWFVGPNNGIVAFVAQHYGGCEGRRLSNPRFYLDNPSATFHGRDIFAPAAAHLAAGVPVEELAPELVEIAGLPMSEAVFDRNAIEGNIVYFDHFGNAITNITRELYNESLASLGSADGMRVQVQVCSVKVPEIVTTYSDVMLGETLAYWGSLNCLEIGINHGDARAQHQLNLLDKVIVTFLEKPATA